MSCKITEGRSESCKDALGGINAVYFFNYKQGLFTVDNDTGLCTGVSEPTDTYEYITRHQSNLEETITATPANGTVFFSQATNLVLKKLDSKTSTQVRLLSWGRPQIVVATNNGDALLVGNALGNDISGGTISTGIEKGDLNGYTLNFLGEEKYPAYFLEGAIAGDPFAGAGFADVTVITGNPATMDITAANHAGYTSGDNANTVDAILTVTTSVTGSYSISTDTVNGYSFSASGNADAGVTVSVNLVGSGIVGAAGTDNFTISASVGTITGVTALAVTVV